MSDRIERWQEFRRAREAELTQPRGWLTLTGFHWLPETPTELGGLPGRWSTDGEDAFLDASPQDGLSVDGGLLDGRSRKTMAETSRAPWAEFNGTEIELLVECFRRGRQACGPPIQSARESPVFQVLTVSLCSPAARSVTDGKVEQRSPARSVHELKGHRIRLACPLGWKGHIQAGIELYSARLIRLEEGKSMAAKTIGNRTHRSATVLSGLGLAAATMLLITPSAAAVPTSITVHPGPGIGSAQFGTGCTYKVDAGVDAAGPVDFYIKPSVAGGQFTKLTTVTANGPGTVTANWTPTETGDFVLNVNKGGEGKSAPPVTVGTGINLGSSCIAR